LINLLNLFFQHDTVNTNNFFWLDVNVTLLKLTTKDILVQSQDSTDKHMFCKMLNATRSLRYFA
jgi:hypothetical protein